MHSQEVHFSQDLQAPPWQQTLEQVQEQLAEEQQDIFNNRKLIGLVVLVEVTMDPKEAVS